MLAQRKKSSDNNPQQQILDLCLQLQQDELFALQSIYLSDFEFNRAQQPFQFTILVKPYVDQDYFSHENIVFGRLIIQFPLEYPIKKQGFGFQFEGISKHFSTDFSKKAQDLVENTIVKKENDSEYQEFGDSHGPIVFQIIETLREWMFIKSQFQQELQDNSQKIQSKNPLYIQAMPKFNTYTVVTPESFAIWKKKFEQERFEKKRLQSSYVIDEEISQKLTGKMYFSKDKISENQKILEVDINDDDAEELEEDDFIMEEDEESDDNEEQQQNDQQVINTQSLLFFYYKLNQDENQDEQFFQD